MRLLEFRPRGYRNLSAQPFYFSALGVPEPTPDCSIRFLVGVNGTGKTNLLRFLASIFAAIDEDYRRPQPGNPAYNTPFQFHYQLRGNDIVMASKGRGRSGVQFTVGDTEYKPGELPGKDAVLPRAVVVYTSGDFDTWHTLLQPPSFELAEPDNADEPLPDVVLPEEESDPEDFLNLEADVEEFVRKEQIRQEREASEDKTEGEELRRRNTRVVLIEPRHLPLALLAALVQHYAAIGSTRQGLNRRSPDGTALPSTIDFSDVLKQVNIARVISFGLELLLLSGNLTRGEHDILQGASMSCRRVLKVVSP